MPRSLQDRNFYGHGVEWTEELEREILDRLDQVSIIELIPENFFDNRRNSFLRELSKNGTPVMIHGVELSLGSDEPLKQSHLDRILEVGEAVNAVNFSDHLCMTESGGVEIGQLTPVPWTIEMADKICRKIDRVQSRVQVPFLIENITNRFLIPDVELTETEFINRIVDRTGCYLLLDLHNIYVNGVNFGFDPHQWLEEIDLDSVLAIHLAGGYYDDEGALVDSHSARVPEPVWDLYRYVCERITPACTIVERTDDVPPYADLLGEVERARGLLLKSQFFRLESEQRLASSGGVR